MRAVRITAYQNMASYRQPSSFVMKESYPLPPYASVIGMVHAACGFTEYVPMQVSIQGYSASSISELYTKYEFGRYTKYEEGRHNVKLQGGEDLLGMTRGMGHVEVLIDVQLILHIFPEDEQMTERIYEGLLRPKNYLALGRWEDLIRIGSVCITELTESEAEDSIQLPCDAYIPVESVHAQEVSATVYCLNKCYQVEAGSKIRTWTERVRAKFARTATVIESGERILLDREACIDADSPYYGINPIPVFLS